jgi:hypothetical protein
MVSSRQRRAAEFVQALAALLSGGGVENVDGRLVVHFVTPVITRVQNMIRFGSPRMGLAAALGIVGRDQLAARH